jgi:rRNA biogenesis protein RRP5
MSKHAKKRRKEDKERAIREAERRRLEGAAAPTTAAEYEQLAMSSPNSSFVWIRYMAFLLSLGELERARTVADRAIKTIHYREEGEKFNVWVAWLNAENAYGTEEGTLQLLNRAITHTDARRMYLAAVDIFERTEKASLADQCLKTMCRKFSGSKEVWLRVIRYRLSTGDADGAKRAMDRALQALPTSDHVAMATQTALIEFKVGDAERGRSIFEGVLANYPRRLDLWAQYLDQEIARGGDRGRVLSLFERATHLALPPKKMKFLFKRYLEYEREHGDEAGVEHVKKAAMEFVERAMAGA